MTWRLAVRHRTGYVYEAPVIASFNEARMTPFTDLHQTTISAELVTEPATVVHRYWDYWGTQVAAFDLHQPHDRLTITSSAVVETEPSSGPSGTLDWTDLLAAQVQDDFTELLDPTTTCRSTTGWAIGHENSRPASRRPMPCWPSAPGCTTHSNTSPASPVCTRQPSRHCMPRAASARTMPILHS
jgi:transglutaminase-like putative cysteine protease